jgi:nitric oxide reductase NorE protein
VAELSGGTVIWLFVALELLTFGLFFLAYAAMRGGDVATFDAAQAMLHPGLGAINTGVLLTGGWLAARGVLANRNGQARSTALCLAGAAGTGLVFMAIKAVEYAEVFAAGISLATNMFWFFYLFLTGLHFLHVLAGVGFLLPVAWRAGHGAYGPRDALSVEAVAIFWHLVDVIWIVLFPLLYLVH